MLFLDNFFTAIPLLIELAKKDIHFGSTLRSNTLPRADEVLGSVKSLLEKDRGSISVASSEDNITVIRWVNSGIVGLISTFAGVETTDTVEMR